jgi:hypothetical protein
MMAGPIEQAEPPPPRRRDPAPKEENKWQKKKKERKNHKEKTTRNCKEIDQTLLICQKNHVNNAIYLRPSVFHVAVVGDLFLLLAGGGEEVEECEDSTSSEQHRFTAAMVVLATLVWTLPVTSCRISV